MDPRRNLVVHDRIWQLAAVLLLVSDGVAAQGANKEDAADQDKECKKGKVDACVRLGVSVAEDDPARAVALFRSACDRGSAVGCDNLGLLTAQGNGVEANDKKAIALFSKACDRKHGLGCLHLAAMYFDGFGVEQDWKRTTSLSCKACDYGEPYGCEWAANFYRTAPQVGLDPKKAVTLEARGRELRSAKPASAAVASVTDAPRGP